jgi:DNA-binding response OmpR family regulator
VSTKVLVVDDERKIVDLVKLYLEKEGFEVITAIDGEEALSGFRAEQPDLIILDLLLPKISGIDLCRLIRQESRVPIIMLTAKSEEVDKLVGLELGADDYVAKPFSPRELVARVRAILRRMAEREPRQGGAEEIIRLGELTVDSKRHQVRRGGKEIELTPSEFRLLWIMASRPGQVFTRGQLIESTQGFSFEGYERTIDAHIKNLRQKIEKDPRSPQFIKTVFGVGYKVEVPRKNA